MSPQFAFVPSTGELRSLPRRQLQNIPVRLHRVVSTDYYPEQLSVRNISVITPVYFLNGTSILLYQVTSAFAVADNYLFLCHQQSDELTRHLSTLLAGVNTPCRFLDLRDPEEVWHYSNIDMEWNADFLLVRVFQSIFKKNADKLQKR